MTSHLVILFVQNMNKRHSFLLVPVLFKQRNKQKKFPRNKKKKSSSAFKCHRKREEKQTGNTLKGQTDVLINLVNCCSVPSSKRGLLIDQSRHNACVCACVHACALLPSTWPFHVLIASLGRQRAIEGRREETEEVESWMRGRPLFFFLLEAFMSPQPVLWNKPSTALNIKTKKRALCQTTQEPKPESWYRIHVCNHFLYVSMTE